MSTHLLTNPIQLRTYLTVSTLLFFLTCLLIQPVVCGWWPFCLMPCRRSYLFSRVVCFFLLHSCYILHVMHHFWNVIKAGFLSSPGVVAPLNLLESPWKKSFPWNSWNLLHISIFSLNLLKNIGFWLDDDFLVGKVGFFTFFLVGKDTREIITLKDNKYLTITGNNE